jgi:hypothetical protein
MPGKFCWLSPIILVDLTFVELHQTALGWIFMAGRALEGGDQLTSTPISINGEF